MADGPMSARRRRTYPGSVLVPLVVVVLLLTGCVGQAPDTTAVTGGSEPPAPSATTGAVQAFIRPGDVWQEVVDDFPPGTTFAIASGEHRGATVVARSGDRFIGEEGAVMNGAVVVEDWSSSGQDLWEAGGFVADSEPLGELLEGWQQQGYRQELFMDGERLTHVDSEENVRLGHWWFDIEGQRLVIGDDPTERLLELSQVESAFTGPRTEGVAIHGLEVKQYASLSQGAAIDGLLSLDWTISDVEVHNNHAGGIRVDRGTIVVDSLIRDNGQVGINGSQQDDPRRPIAILSNEIVGNTALNYVWFWETGGVKLTYAQSPIIHGNTVTGNLGPGIWCDLDCFDGVISNNVVVDNSAVGIFYEISDSGTIAGNEVTGNGFGIGPEFASGIWLSNSGNTTVTGNVLSGNTNEVLIVAAPREEFGFPVSGNLISANDITVSEGFVGLSVVTDQPELYDPDLNTFRGNNYTLDGCEPCFFWDVRITTEEWLALGNDVGSTFSTEDR